MELKELKNKIDPIVKETIANIENIKLTKLPKAKLNELLVVEKTLAISKIWDLFIYSSDHDASDMEYIKSLLVVSEADAKIEKATVLFKSDYLDR